MANNIRNLSSPSGGIAGRDDCWSEWIRVGNAGLFAQVENEFGLRAASPGFGGRSFVYSSRAGAAYGAHFDMENEALRPNSTVPWQTNFETTEA
jgi:hypothetical protein